MYFEWRDTENQQYSNYIPNDVPAVFFDMIYLSLLFKSRVEENLLFHDSIISYLTQKLSSVGC